VYSIPLAITQRQREKKANVAKGGVPWSQLKQQWLEMAEKEKKSAKQTYSSRRNLPHKEFLWLPTDCLLEIFRCLGRQSLGALCKSAWLVSKSVTELISKHMDIWMESCVQLGGIPHEYLHGGASDVTEIESGNFSQLVASRYVSYNQIFI
jgi:hypothetical protein